MLCVYIDVSTEAITYVLSLSSLSIDVSASPSSSSSSSSIVTKKDSSVEREQEDDKDGRAQTNAQKPSERNERVDDPLCTFLKFHSVPCNVTWDARFFSLGQTELYVIGLYSFLYYSIILYSITNILYLAIATCTRSSLVSP